MLFWLLTLHSWLNWIEHLTTDQEVKGSNPFECTNFYNNEERKTMSLIMWTILTVVVMQLLRVFVKSYLHSYYQAEMIERVCNDALKKGGSVRIEKID